jgi:ubiquinone biosynthesis monooxygenase Coq7
MTEAAGDHPRHTADRLMPGDPSPAALVDRIIRVDHAGEYGAVRIYAGQLAVMAEGPAKEAVRKMAKQEKDHLAAFDKLLVERRARPTVLQPLWHVAGFALGAATALLGPRAAMACTVAVEEAIDEHYAAQARALGDDEKALRATIEEFRHHELEHRDTALAHEAEKAPAYPVLSAAIKTGSRLAIWLSERV